MKKFVLAILLIGAFAAIFSSCGPSKRGYGCPAAEGVIH